MTRVLRIVALGDSTTAGTPAWQSPLEAPPDGCGEETSQYAYWLTRAHPEWQVLNRGIDGQRTDEIAARFDRDVLGVRPAAVAIIAGVNDVYQGVPVEHVTAQLLEMYDRALRGRIALVAGSIIPYNTATPAQNAAMHRINDWIRRRAADDARIGYVDTRAAVAAESNPDLLFDSPDGLHPTAEGYRRMAEAIRPALERALSVSGGGA